jgi:hypothetical protein
VLLEWVEQQGVESEDFLLVEPHIERWRSCKTAQSPVSF